jgi:hypothetical protein
LRGFGQVAEVSMVLRQDAVAGQELFASLIKAAPDIIIDHKELRLQEKPFASGGSGAIYRYRQAPAAHTRHHYRRHIIIIIIIIVVVVVTTCLTITHGP